MGWLFTNGSTCKSQIAELTKGWDSGIREDGTRSVRKVLAHCYRQSNPGNGVLWTVNHIVSYDKDGKVVKNLQVIGCDLLQYQRGYGWGYKDMDETCGPNEVNCPLSYLAMSTVNDGYAAEWKQRVREYHAKKQAENDVRKSLKVGDFLKLKRCKLDMVRVVQVGRTIYGTRFGDRYKIPRKMIDRIATKEEVEQVYGRPIETIVI